MPENTSDVVRFSERDKAALEWLARAIPVPVSIGDDKVDTPNSAGVYYGRRDAIAVVSPDHDDWNYAGGFLATLAHEAIHSTKTKDRLSRRLSAADPLTQYFVEAADWPRLFEEMVADLGAIELSKRLGFEVGLMEVRSKAFYEDAPPNVRVVADEAVEKAIAWLSQRAAEVDKRPFDDDLKTLVDQLTGARV